jgi:nucleotide sugar dehydrogenase
MNICVIALGKMGLPIAALYASRGHHVIGADINPTLVSMINEGDSPISHEPGLTEMVQSAVASGNLRATTDTVMAVRASEIVIVLVPLLVQPQLDFIPDYEPLDRAMHAIGQGIQPGTLVILETTVPVGDTRNRFAPIIAAESGLHPGKDFLMAFSPERVQSNHVLHNLMQYPKVVGGIDSASTEAAKQFYSDTLVVRVLAVSSCEAAEFTKIAECVYRDVNIALANELAICATNAGLDILEIIATANSEPLSHIHLPGVGVGGHCIPVYPYFMINKQSPTQLASLARRINDNMARYAIQQIETEMGTLTGRDVLILGLGYRANVKEAAFSSTLLLARALQDKGARFHIYDPLFTPEEIAHHSAQPAIDLANLPPLTAIIVQAWHDEFKSIDWRQFRGNPLVLDGRNAVDANAVLAAGLRYRAIGHGRIQEPLALA